MGIQGLLPLLKSIHEHRKISEFSGQTLAVDAYVWLHRGAYGCATELMKGIATTRYVDYVMHRVRLLKYHNIVPYLVFDGGPLPAKRGTESKRLKSREENREKGMALANQGKHSEARECFVKAVDVTPEMAYQLIKALQAEDVAYVVAPYEADAQMAYLERVGVVQGIITEDSDLLVFGCKRVIFKLDSDGDCICIRRENFARVTEIPLHNWADKQFREMAMLSGCDYLPSIQGLGLKTAHKLLRKHKTVEGVLNTIRSKSSLRVPVDYLKEFRKAELAFMHQRVYDPNAKRLIHLLAPENADSWDDAYVGDDMDPDIAQAIAEGSVHPFTLLPMPDINPSFRPHQRAVMSFTRPKVSKSPHKTPTTKNSTNVLTNYFAPGATARRVRSDSVLPSHSVAAAKENLSSSVTSSGSGKRTLTFEHDRAKQAQLERTQSKLVAPVALTSKFFKTARPGKLVSASQPTLSRVLKLNDAVIDVDADGVVTQEIGYISPTESFAEMVDVSSPPVSREGSMGPDDGQLEVEDSSAESDNILSPPYDRKAPLERQDPPLTEYDNLSSPLPFPTSYSPPTFAVAPESWRYHQSRGASLDDGRNTSSIMCRHLPFPSPEPKRDAASNHSPVQNKRISASGTPVNSLLAEKVGKHTEPGIAPAPSTYDPTSRSKQYNPTMPKTSVSTIFVIETPRRPRRPKRSRSPSWGPDLQDVLSPVHSEAGSVILGSEVPSPEAERKAKPRLWGSPDYQDAYNICTPGAKGAQTAISVVGDEELDVEDEGDPLDIRTHYRTSKHLEAKWHEKWANRTPLLKRKQEATSPRTAHHPKRLPQPNVRSSATESLASPMYTPSTTTARASTGPHQSSPLLGASIQGRTRKSLSRQVENGAPGQETSNYVLSRSREIPLDLGTFKLNPLRLR